MRIEFETARGRVVPGRGSQMAAFSVMLDVYSEQMNAIETTELATAITRRIADVIAEEFGGEEIEWRRRSE